MKVLGITGGVGSGKSEVLRFLEEEYNAAVCQLDEVAKKLQKRGAPCYERIAKEFGSGVIGTDGELDRQVLAALIFRDEEKRKAINEIVHPEVKRWVEKDMTAKREQKVPLYVIEAALLPEAGYEDICREMWYVYAGEEVRRKRLKESRGYSDDRISRMMQSQSPEQAYREACHTVIDNSGAFEETEKAIRARAKEAFAKEEIGDRT